MAPYLAESTVPTSVAATNGLEKFPSKSYTTTEVREIESPVSETENPITTTTYEELTRIPNPALTVTPEHTIYLKPHSPIPSQLPATSVLLRVRSTGICGSDIHFWHRGCIGSLTVDGQYTLGHEAAGEVVAVGSAVTNLKIGDRVAMEPGVPCENCFLCQQGRYNLCEKVEFAGVWPYNGSLQRFMPHPAKWCHKLPEEITYQQAALLEPLSVVLHALETCKMGIGIGRPVAICGAGPIGLIAAKAARASGSWPIVITDLEEKRLEFARKFIPGVKTFKVDRDASPEVNADGVRALFGVGKRSRAGTSENEYNAPLVVLECTGVESSVGIASFSCRRGGTVMVVGVGKATMNNLPFMHLSLAEIQLKFINRYRDTWPAGINALQGNVLDLDPLVTHKFPLEQATEAFDLAADVSKGSIKIQIVDDVDLSTIPRI